MSLPAASYLSNAARTEGEEKTALEDQLKGIKQIPGAGASEQALTIAAGSITPASGSSGVIAVDTEAAAATDDLTNIAQTNVDDNSLLILRNANAARVVVVKNNAGGTGQISLKSGGDFVLADPDRHWLLVKRAGTLFKEVACWPPRDLAPILSKSGNYTTTPADRGQFIDCTATLTLTLLAAATAGKGFEQLVQCSGGIVTLDGNASETIDGATTLTLQRGDKVRIVCDGSNWKVVERFSAQWGMPVHGHLWGLTLSNNVGDATNDIDVAVGEAMSDDTNAEDMVLMRLTSAITKQLDAAWAVGNNAGGRDTGAIANGTWHVYLIMRPDTGVVDVLLSTSASAPTMPTNYTKKRRIGAILRESAAIVGFVQDADVFQRTTPVLDVDATNPGASAVTRTLSVPTGINVRALLNVLTYDSTQAIYLLLSDLACTDAAPSTTAAPLNTFGSNTGGAAGGIGPIAVRTNTSAQIRSRVNVSGASSVVRLATLGWIDTRGRLN